MSCTKKKVFIDGSAGTTGLRIADRLSGAAFADKIELLTISDVDRKDVAARAAVINSADLAFLCLPDAASKEVMPLVSPTVKILDTSTAFRTHADWTYGFPELSGTRAALETACRIAVPGCHASGFIALVRPLVEGGYLPAAYPFTCHSITGYSGGGKAMIAEYEVPKAAEGAGHVKNCENLENPKNAQNDDKTLEMRAHAESTPTPRAEKYDAPRAYGLTLSHKHLPEMQQICGITAAPIFCPIVADYYSGMHVNVPVHLPLCRQIAGSDCANGVQCVNATDDVNNANGTVGANGTDSASAADRANSAHISAAAFAEALRTYYNGAPQITVHPLGATPPDGMISVMHNHGSDALEIFINASPSGEQVLLSAVFDNLGKGSSGAAVQCMNLCLGFEETLGLE